MSASATPLSTRTPRSQPRSTAELEITSGRFAANAAWLVLACLAFNLTRAAGALASRRHGKATTATLREQLIHIPARVAHSAREQTLHLPEDWPWQDTATALFDTLHTPPIAA